MGKLNKLKPAFWDHQVTTGPESHTGFNFRRKWKLLVLFTSFMALLPLFVMTLMDFNLTRRIIEQEEKASMAKTLTSAATSFSVSIDREKSTMEKILMASPTGTLLTPGRLTDIYKNLLLYSNGIVHVSLTSTNGRLLSESGALTPGEIASFPFLTEDLFSGPEKDIIFSRVYIQEKTTTPYLMLSMPDPYETRTVLNFILDIEILARNIGLIESGEHQDIFIINESGTLLTPSFYFGKPGTPNGTPNLFNLESFRDNQGFTLSASQDKVPLIAGHTRLSALPVIFILTKPRKELETLWLKPRMKLISYLAVSIVLILMSIMGTATYLINRIHAADQKRVQALHHAEYTNKLASIGRLASGVAHEINNPLEIINQKTGLITDLFAMKEEFASDSRLMPLANDIMDAVDRCGSITRRLLDFARHMEPSIESINIENVLGQVLAFLKKDGERKAITIKVKNKTKLPDFQCDKGSLQQIFLNLIENAFAAMKDGGRLDIFINNKDKQTVILTFSDNGCGISEEDIPKIFEPFYSSKDDRWGRGLGLSTTYGLVKELGGDIMVKSRMGKGSRFTLTLPLIQQKTEETDA